ncbi:MAG: HEAT repeat domain-containing protein [Promethearchaeia archaeon]
MSLKLEIKDNYPEEIKRLIQDYNNGIDMQDIMEVNIAIDGLLTLVFHNDKNIRDFAGIVLSKIANAQPGFLKKGIQVLIHRYKKADQDPEKSEYASTVLGLLIETPARQLITDQTLLEKIAKEHAERLSRIKFEEEQKKQFLERVKAKEIKFIGISGDFLRIGQYYNKLIIDENTVQAQKVVEDLIKKIIELYSDDEKINDFEMGCALFSIIAHPDNREPLIKDVIANTLKLYQESKKKTKDALNEFFIKTINSIYDLLPPKLAQDFKAIADKRIEDKKKEQLEKIKLLKEFQKKAINIDVTWERPIKELAETYNNCIKSRDDKELAKCIELFKTNLLSKDPYIKKSAINLFSQILEKNFEIISDFTKKLIKDYKKPEIAIILEENLPILDKLGLLEKGIKNFLEQDKAQREAKEREEKERLQKELERIERLKVEFSAEWDKRLLDIIESINENFINEKFKNAEKIILGTLKNYIYAEDKEIQAQAIEFLNNVAKKYPDIIKKIMKEILDLFNSEHEMRYVAVDLLGLLYKNPNKEVLFEGLDDEFFKKLEEDIEKREEEIKQAHLMDKWDAIKLDVATIVVSLEYDKKLQKVCRAYNDAVKNKDLKKAVENVQIIIDWFLNEKDEERLNHIIEVLGKIAKQNIELIAPAIEMFLKMVDSKDEDTKFRAIKGLGEVTVQRPGWAYMGIEKLVQLATTDENETARMKALVELSRIGKSNPTMLIEHIEALIKAIKDPNKHVRRLAVWTINSMAEAIPTEAQEAIPALREALHDEYHLVRLFADKALKNIRAAMRK